MSTEEEYDEQEYLVYVDLETLVSPDEFGTAGIDFKIIGVDADHPIVQVNGKPFRGTYDFCVGTNVFFEFDPNPPVVDPLYDITPNNFYRISAMTRKVLKMELIFVENLRPNDNTSDSDIIAELKVCKKPNMSYGDALNLLLPEGGVPPRKLLSADLEIPEIPSHDPCEVDGGGASSDANARSVDDAKLSCNTGSKDAHKSTPKTDNPS